MPRRKTCLTCSHRQSCRAACPAMDALLRKETHHFRPQEILTSPAMIGSLAAVVGFTHADLICEEVHPWEVRRIPGLTKRQIRALQLNVAGRLSQRRIASRMHLGQATVGEHLIAARRKARRYLEEALHLKKKPS